MTEKFEERKERGWLSKQIVRLQRGRFYASMLQFMLIAVLTIRSFDVKAIIGISQFWATALAIILVLPSVWLIGFFVDKWGLFSSIKEYKTRLNPKWKRLFKKLDKIEKDENERADR